MSIINLRNKNLSGFITLFGKAIVILICFLMIFFIFNGCDRILDFKDNIFSRFTSEKDQNSAVETVDVFLNHIVNRELEQAYDYIYIREDSKKDMDDFISEFSAVTQIISFEINRVEVENNIAVVEVDLIDTYDNEKKLYKDLKISLVKDDNDEWKINFWQ